MLTWRSHEHVLVSLACSSSDNRDPDCKKELNAYNELNGTNLGFSCSSLLALKYEIKNEKNAKEATAQLNSQIVKLTNELTDVKNELTVVKKVENRNLLM